MRVYLFFRFWRLTEKFLLGSNDDQFHAATKGIGIWRTEAAVRYAQQAAIVGGKGLELAGGNSK